MHPYQRPLSLSHCVNSHSPQRQFLQHTHTEIWIRRESALAHGGEREKERERAKGRGGEGGRAHARNVASASPLRLTTATTHTHTHTHTQNTQREGGNALHPSTAKRLTDGERERDREGERQNHTHVHTHTHTHTHTQSPLGRYIPVSTVHNPERQTTTRTGKEAAGVATPCENGRAEEREGMGGGRG